MSLQWTLIAGFLYSEVALLVILLLPFISATKWNKIFKWKLITSLSNLSKYYFKIIIAILVFLVFDAYRDMEKYGKLANNQTTNGKSEYLIREFRAQRNFFITGISLFLSFLNEMSLQWTLIATFLYVEVALIIILLLPFISATRWQKIFKSRLITGLKSYAGLYFNVILVALVLFLLDAIREISKYKTRLNSSNDPSHGTLHYGPTMELVKEFRAQRNFYISGTSLFLWFVIKRLIALIQNTAHLEAENEAIKKQAESATRVANDLIKESSLENKSSDNSELEKQLLISREETDNLKTQLEKAKLNLDTIIKQSKGVSDEYDNLLKEHAKVCAKLERLEYESNQDTRKDK